MTQICLCNKPTHVPLNLNEKLKKLIEFWVRLFTEKYFFSPCAVVESATTFFVY